MTDNPTIQIVCSICGKTDPHVTSGCDAEGCTWRLEAAENLIRDGGEAHVTGGGLTPEDKAKRLSRVSIAVWPKVKGNA